MSTLLAADIGKRRTGLALADTKAGFIMALDTLHHTSDVELIDLLAKAVKTRKVDEIIIGLPLLPQGKEGEQAAYVRSVATLLGQSVSAPIEFMDERYTSPRNGQPYDPDATAACALLSVALSRRIEQ
jgi:putative Holliday junction resolvase